MPFGWSFRDVLAKQKYRRTDISGVGESTLDVGEQTVGETTRRRNDRIPWETANQALV